MSLRTVVLQQRVEAFLAQLDGLLAPEPAPARVRAGTDELIADIKKAPAVTAGADQNNYPRKERVMTESTQPTPEEYADRLAGDIERYAAFIRANPDIAAAWIGDRFLIPLSNKENPAAVMADILRRGRRAGATVTKNVNDTYAGALLSFGSITVDVYAQRDLVCERVVVGTHEEQVEEQDPEALAAVPVVKVKKTVEDVEWRCTPLLAAERAYESELATEQAGAVA